MRGITAIDLCHGQSERKWNRHSNPRFSRETTHRRKRPQIGDSFSSCHRISKELRGKKVFQETGLSRAKPPSELFGTGAGLTGSIDSDGAAALDFDVGAICEGPEIRTLVSSS